MNATGKENNHLRAKKVLPEWALLWKIWKWHKRMTYKNDHDEYKGGYLKTYLFLSLGLENCILKFQTMMCTAAATFLPFLKVINHFDIFLFSFHTKTLKDMKTSVMYQIFQEYVDLVSHATSNKF